MFRSMFRVLVVVCVVLSLTVLAVPSAQAGPGKASMVRNDDEEGLLQAVVAWLLGVPKHEAPKSKTAGGKVFSMNGPCIDPMGRPIPCL